MILRHCFAALAVALLALAASAVACAGTSSGSDGGTDGPVHDAAGEKTETCVDAGPALPTLIELSVAATHPSGSGPALGLVPPFSPKIHDYYVRCPAATNALTVTMEANSCNGSELTQPMTTTAKPGKQTFTGMSVKANQAVVAVATSGSTNVEYWVRCLPPDFPPIQMVAHPSAGTPTAGYYLVGNYSATGPTGGYAMVLDGNGVPVWYHLEPKGGVCDVESLANGSISYTPVVGPFDPLPFEQFDVKTVKETNLAPSGAPLDIHELRALPDGSYVAISDPVQTGIDLTGLAVPLPDGGTTPGGPNSNILGCNVVEFMPSGTVTWTWQATDHLDTAKISLQPELAQNVGDSGVADGGLIFYPLHCNSVDVDPANGNVLVSARDANTFFYVEKATGKILWRMGGASAGTLDPGAAYIPAPSPAFNGQHDVRLQPGWSTCSGGQISLYDDESYGSGSPARAVVYDVKLGGGSACDGGIPEGGTPTATQTWQYAGAPDGKPATASGSFRISSDGSKVIGWGLLFSTAGTVFTEVNDAGQPMLDFESSLMPPPLPPPMGSYRAIKVPVTTFDLESMRMSAGQ